MKEPGKLVTADTVTDEQIRSLWRASAIDSYTRDLAIRTYRGAGETWRREARQRCADENNARHAREERAREERLQTAAERYTRALDAFRRGNSNDTTALSAAARELATTARAFAGAA